MKKIAIFGKTKRRARIELKNMINEVEIKYMDICKVIKNPHELIIELNNGTIYKAIATPNFTMGEGFNFAYIDARINRNIVHEKILPMIPYDQYMYY